MIIINMPSQNFNPSSGPSPFFPSGPGLFPNGCTGEQFCDENEIARSPASPFVVMRKQNQGSATPGPETGPMIAFELVAAFTSQALAFASLTTGQFLAVIDVGGADYTTAVYITANWIAGATPP